MGEIVARVVFVMTLVVPFALIVSGLLEFFSLLLGWTGGKVMRLLRSIRSINRRVKIARRKTTWGAKGGWLIVLGVFLSGTIVWTIAAFEFQVVPKRFYSDLGELGAAIAGGAAVGIAVLVVQLRVEKESKKGNVQFELSLQKEASGLDLRGYNLRGSYFLNKNFGEANLSGAKFDGSILRGCDFRAKSIPVRNSTLLFGANFTGANGFAHKLEAMTRSGGLFRVQLPSLVSAPDFWCKAGANLKYAKFDGAYLSSADFSGADLTDATLSAAFLDEGNEPNTQEHFGAANLSGAVLVRVDLRKAFLAGVKLIDAKLIDADLEGADLKRLV